MISISRYLGRVLCGSKLGECHFTSKSNLILWPPLTDDKQSRYFVFHGNAVSGAQPNIPPKSRAVVWLSPWGRRFGRYNGLRSNWEEDVQLPRPKLCNKSYEENGKNWWTCSLGSQPYAEQVLQIEKLSPQSSFSCGAIASATPAEISLDLTPNSAMIAPQINMSHDIIGSTIGDLLASLTTPISAPNTKNEA